MDAVPLWPTLIWPLCLIALTLLLTLMETAADSLSESRLEHLADEGESKARSILKRLDDCAGLGEGIQCARHMTLLLLGFLSGQPLIPVCSILGQWALGFFAAYGGRRSDLGRHDSGQILGLRSYLKHLPRDGINRLLNNDPDYFFNMAPYALALGVIRPYADAFGRRKMEDCPYLFLRTN